MKTLIILTAVPALVTLTVALGAMITLTVAAVIQSCTAVAPTAAPGQAAGTSPEEIQRHNCGPRHAGKQTGASRLTHPRC